MVQGRALRTFVELLKRLPGILNIRQAFKSNKNSVIKENREMDHNAPCIDIDECAETHTDFTFECDMNSECQNSYGSYYCVCNDGYEGDGKTCDRLIPENAECRDSECLELRCQIGSLTKYNRISRIQNNVILSVYDLGIFDKGTNHQQEISLLWEKVVST